MFIQLEVSSLGILAPALAYSQKCGFNMHQYRGRNPKSSSILIIQVYSFLRNRYGRVRYMADFFVCRKGSICYKNIGYCIHHWVACNFHRFTVDTNQSRTAHNLSHGQCSIHVNSNIASFLEVQDLCNITPCRWVSTFRRPPYSETVVRE
jgi:hypothetical protein